MHIAKSRGHGKRESLSVEVKMAADLHRRLVRDYYIGVDYPRSDESWPHRVGPVGASAGSRRIHAVSALEEAEKQPLDPERRRAATGLCLRRVFRALERDAAAEDKEEQEGRSQGHH